MAVKSYPSFPEGAFTTENPAFIRLRSQTLTIGQQQILDGFGFESNWVEQAIPTSSSRYGEFTVPAGYKMVLSLRDLNPSGDNFLYKVYPQGSYTIGATKVDDADNFAKTRNLRQDAPFISQFLLRREVSVLPAASAHIIYATQWGQINAGNRSVGALGTNDSYLMLNGNQSFLLEMRNNGATNAMNAQVLLQYAFIPESRVSPILAT